MSAIIEIKNLSFAYDEESQQKTLSQIDLTIEQGQWVALIGHNGSGKSTLAKLLDGLLTPTEGTITVAGLPLNEENIWEIRDQIGMVFQNPDNQFVGADVEGDVAFGLENRGVSYEQMHQRVKEALEAVNMQAFAKHEPVRLSGGQKQRVAVARAIITDPALLLADEPTGALDSKTSDQLLDIFEQLNQNGQTILMVTHSSLAASRAKRVLFIKDGIVYHQLYRGELDSKAFLEKINMTMASLLPR